MDPVTIGLVASVAAPLIIGKVFGGKKAPKQYGPPTANSNLSSGQDYAASNKAAYTAGRGFRSEV